MSGFAVSVGVYTGGLGITVSHELVHKVTRLEQWLGESMALLVDVFCCCVLGCCC